MRLPSFDMLPSSKPGASTSITRRGARTYWLRVVCTPNHRKSRRLPNRFWLTVTIFWCLVGFFSLFRLVGSMRTGSEMKSERNGKKIPKQKRKKKKNLSWAYPFSVTAAVATTTVVSLFLFFRPCFVRATKSPYIRVLHVCELGASMCVRCACMNNLLSDFDIVLQRLWHFHIFRFGSMCCVLCIWSWDGKVYHHCWLAAWLRCHVVGVCLCFVCVCVLWKKEILRRCPVVWMNNR